MLINIPLFIPTLNFSKKINKFFINNIKSLEKRNTLSYVILQITIILYFLILIVYFASFNQIIYAYSIFIPITLFIISQTLINDYEYCLINLKLYNVSKDIKYLQKTFLRLNYIYNKVYSVIGIYRLIGLIDISNSLKNHSTFEPTLEQLSTALKEVNVNDKEIIETINLLFENYKNYEIKMGGVVKEPNLPLSIKLKSNYPTITVEIFKNLTPSLIIILILWIIYPLWTITKILY